MYIHLKVLLLLLHRYKYECERLTFLLVCISRHFDFKLN